MVSPPERKPPSEQRVGGWPKEAKATVFNLESSRAFDLIRRSLERASLTRRPEAFAACSRVPVS